MHSIIPHSPASSSAPVQQEGTGGAVSSLHVLLQSSSHPSACWCCWLVCTLQEARGQHVTLRFTDYWHECLYMIDFLSIAQVSSTLTLWILNTQLWCIDIFKYFLKSWSNRLTMLYGQYCANKLYLRIVFFCICIILKTVIFVMNPLN